MIDTNDTAVQTARRPSDRPYDKTKRNQPSIPRLPSLTRRGPWGVDETEERCDCAKAESNAI